MEVSENTPQTMDEHGNWVPMEPVPLLCEHLGCDAVADGFEYEREDKNQPNGWGEEPEFLCAHHASKRKRCGE